MKNSFQLFIILGIALLVFSQCQDTKKLPLPIIGNISLDINGDTLYHEIPDFSFINQDNKEVNTNSLSEYVYVSDFFFMSCPSICPKVKKQMLRIYKTYGQHPRFKLVSHTIDPKRDTPERLKSYAENLNVDVNEWMFLTGDKEAIFDIADDYFVSAFEDADAPGGFDHSGKIILVDTQRHIRSFGDGTDPKEVDKLLKDIGQLLAEYEN